MKKILLVDDRYDALADLIRKLREKFEVELAESIDEAIQILEEDQGAIKGVILDLYIPGKSKIDHYQSKYDYKNNQGQSLGIYLSESFPDIKYFYLTNFPNNLTGDETGKPLISKKARHDEIINFCTENFK